MMMLSSLLGIVFTVAGLWFSFTYDLTSGATIIMIAGGAFFISLIFENIKGRLRSGATG